MGVFKRLSVGTCVTVNSDLIIYDRQEREIVFASMIGYSTQIDMNIREMNMGITHCYTSFGSLKTSKENYYTEIKKQGDSDYLHAVAYLEDCVVQDPDGEIITAYLYCKTHEDLDKVLYKKLNTHSSVPIIEEWIPYIRLQLFNRRALRELDVESKEPTEMQAYKLVADKELIKNIISNGLRGCEISLNGINSPSPILGTIKGLDAYLESFGEILAAKIQNSFKPKFIPGEDSYDEYTNNVDDCLASENIEMYEAQKSVIQATVNNLKVNDSTFVIGEMGSGKSLIGSCIPYAHNASKKGFNAAILCPAHLASKWKREIERAVPNSKGYVVENFEDFKSLESKLRNPNKVEKSYVIFTKERAKMNYDLRPAAVWSKRKKAFVCPECGQVLYTVEKYKIDNRTYEEHVPFSELSMSKKLVFNSRCMNTVKVWDEGASTYLPKKCNSTLWTPLNRDEENSKWIKLGKEGWILKEHIESVTEDLMTKEKLNKKDSALFNRLYEQYMLIKDGEVPHVSYKGPKRYAISKYIRERMKNVFDYAIIDEAHQYKGLTEQGQAAADIMQASKKSILLTGTLLNGYADGLFYLLWRTNPRTMLKEGFKFTDEAAFAKTYGVYSKEMKFKLDRHLPPSRVGGMKEKRLPGVSPLVFTKFLLNSSVFLSLSDMADGLPEYEEIPISVELDEKTSSSYTDMENYFATIADPRSDESPKIMGAMLQALTVYPDAPHCSMPIMDPDTGDLAYEPNKLDKKLRPKEIELLNLVKERLENGEKVLVYYNSVNKTDIGNILIDLLKNNGITAYEMKSSVSADSREEWVEKHLEKGMEVMICNPSLVETGLDLLDFTSIIFYQIGYNLFTMRQASRRSWRLSQTKAVKVFFMYYRNTIQEQALSLMATKLQASMAIEGKFSEEGLRAMSQNEDILTQIANNVVEGIKDTVNQDLFKATTFVKASSREAREHLKTRAQLEVKMNSLGMKTLFGDKFKEVERRKAVKQYNEDKVNNILKLFC